jgi:hypothetical protein
MRRFFGNATALLRIVLPTRINTLVVDMRVWAPNADYHPLLRMGVFGRLKWTTNILAHGSRLATQREPSPNRRGVAFRVAVLAVIDACECCSF